MIFKHISSLFRKKSRFLCREYSNRNILKLRERNMLQDLFPDTAAKEVTDLLNAAPQCVYAGFDPTADSLHVGNLLVLINLLHWQRAGHNVIALVGGATAKIGDPSGRSTERDELSTAFVDGNVKLVGDNIRRIFDNHEEHIWPKSGASLKPIRILNNESWYKDISAVKLIGSYGRHLRMGTLLSRSSVQTRLNSHAGMSFTEFSYQLFQAYDWLHLFKEHRCKFQIGGNDQMGNIMSGHELISKICEKPIYGLTVPLVTTEMGDKFGKTAGNAVWLSDEKTSPFTLYQFWIRIPDSDVERMLQMFTFDTLGSIEDLMKKHKEKPELRLAQKRLAQQVTLLVHGKAGLEKAEEITKILYEGSIASLGKMRAEEIASLFQGSTVVEVLPESGMSILDLALKAGCFLTKSDATRIISAGGFYINQEKALNPGEIINSATHRLANNVSLLRVGKKNYYVVKWLS